MCLTEWLPASRLRLICNGNILDDSATLEGPIEEFLSVPGRFLVVLVVAKAPRVGSPELRYESALLPAGKRGDKLETLATASNALAQQLCEGVACNFLGMPRTCGSNIKILCS